MDSYENQMFATKMGSEPKKKLYYGPNGHPLSLRSKTDFVSFRPKEYVQLFILKPVVSLFPWDPLVTKVRCQ